MFGESLFRKKTSYSLASMQKRDLHWLPHHKIVIFHCYIILKLLYFMCLNFYINIFVEMQSSEYLCNRRTSYAWSVGFVIASAVLLINFSVCSILLHVWLAVKDQVKIIVRSIFMWNPAYFKEIRRENLHSYCHAYGNDRSKLNSNLLVYTILLF